MPLALTNVDKTVLEIIGTASNDNVNAEIHAEQGPEEQDGYEEELDLETIAACKNLVIWLPKFLFQIFFLTKMQFLRIFYNNRKISYLSRA